MPLLDINGLLFSARKEGNKITVLESVMNTVEDVYPAQGWTEEAVLADFKHRCLL